MSDQIYSPKNIFKFIILITIIILVIFFGYWILPEYFPVKTRDIQNIPNNLANMKKAFHIKTPESVKGIYMTAWVAGNEKLKGKLIEIVDNTEINSIVIDVKDNTGDVSFKLPTDIFSGYSSLNKARVSDIKDLISDFHERGIYLIARIAVFQDPNFVARRPDLAVKKSDKKTVWTDKNKLPWLDAGAKDVWEYIKDLSLYSYNLGFDEINLDYIRFPSDGNMKDIYFPFSEGKDKSVVMESFYKYITEELHKENIPVSADFFGMTTTNTDDLMIGQVLEKALPYFDYISPMVYPSHYPKEFVNIKNTHIQPYETVKYSMMKALQRASTTPWKLRPWLQDFSIAGVVYGSKEVRTQIDAVYDSGFTSWLLWNASSKFTESALEKR